MSFEEDNAAMARFREVYNKTLHAGDLEGWLATLTDDCVVQMHGVPSLTGKEAVRSWFGENHFGVLDVDLDWDFHEIEFCGDRAFGTGWYKQTLTPKDGSEPVNDAGKFIDVFRKDAGGEWRLARLAFSSDEE